MTDATLEAILNRLDKLEERVAKLSSKAAPGDWQSVVGLFGDSEFQRKVDAEIQAMRDAEWQRIRAGEEE